MDEEESQILEIANYVDVAALDLMPEQVKFVTLRVLFLLPQTLLEKISLKKLKSC